MSLYVLGGGRRAYGAVSREELSKYSFELGPIRPPTEAYSLLIRATRNCPWNRCKFCSIYKGTKFELRPIEEIEKDIETAKAIQDKIKEIAARSGYLGRVKETAATIYDNPPNEAFRNVALFLYNDGKNAFLQDSNSIIMHTKDLVKVIEFLKETFPSIERVTSYGRSKQVGKKSVEELRELHEAGLSRLHIGLESGDDEILKFVDKGVTAREHVEAGKKVKASGISLSEYVMPGLGGKQRSKENALHTAEVLNEIEPDYTRIRTTVIREDMPLHAEIRNGNFEPLTEDEAVEEIGSLIENLHCRTNLVSSDHVLNLLWDLNGKLPEDKDKMLSVIEQYKTLSPDEKLNFRLGRRIRTITSTGEIGDYIYRKLDDLYNPSKHEKVEQVRRKLESEGKDVEEFLISLRRGSI
ncbi:MAG: radical SAM protein [Candidatus Aenigmarchaeota archaeon]|nr:radical SAM protein [Candidatus Aenigmarchaeota archaeon]